MLGRIERESPVHAAYAAKAGGWRATAPVDDGYWDNTAAPQEELLDLGGTTDTFATVAALDQLAAVVQIGHPEAPDPQLESYLLSGAPTLMVIRAQAVPPEWVWVKPGDDAGASEFVIVDEAGFRDTRSALQAFGVPLRVVAGRTTVAERIEAAGLGGSLVLERSRVPTGMALLPGSDVLAKLPAVWYGLVDALVEPPEFDQPAQVWLAFGPHDDRRGSLRETLGVFADHGLNLTHLRSQRTAGEQGRSTMPVLALNGAWQGQLDRQDPWPQRSHHFYSAFRCANAGLLTKLRAALSNNGVQHRVLAVLPGSDFQPMPGGIAPRWETNNG